MERILFFCDNQVVLHIA